MSSRFLRRPALLGAMASVLVLAIATVVTCTPAETNAPAGNSTETLRVATYNIEHFNRMFDQTRMPYRSRELTELFRDEEDQYEVARTMKLADFDADIIAIQECCDQEMLEYFNKECLDGRYAYVKVFRGNVPGQYLGMLAKPGFEALDVREYFDVVDPVDDPRIRRTKERAGLAEKNLLFSRGPAFVKFRTPGGSTMWVGCTHVKSKSGNSEAVTEWRIRELRKTRDICEKLISGDTDKLVLLGDFNDDFGKDRHEQTVGTDAVAVMLDGEGKTKLTALTLPLVQKDKTLATYHCEIKPPTYRSFIDHVFVSASLAKDAKKTWVVDDPIAAVASDHYPVVAEFELPAK